MSWATSCSTAFTGSTLTWRGHVVRVPPLALQVAVNRRRGRWDRARLLEAHLRG
jgi:hypothetical protein